MRLIKLSKEEFDTRDEAVSFFVDPESDFLATDKDFGVFNYTRNHIALDGVTAGETLLFSYDGEVIYAAKAASAPLPAHGPESEMYPYYLQVDRKSLREVSLTLAELEQLIRAEVGGTFNLRGQGWTRLPDHESLDVIFWHPERSSVTNLEKIKEAVCHLGEATYRQIKAYIIEKYGPISDAGYTADIVSATVNHTSRGHHQQNKKVRPADNPKYDFLFQKENDTFVLYDPEKHGKWEVTQNAEGKFVPMKSTDDPVPPRHGLSLIGTSKRFDNEYQAVIAAIEERGGWAWWWSFPIDEAAQPLLTTPFYVYLNKSSGVFPYRIKVEEYRTSRGNEGITTPWPELTHESCRNTRRAGEGQSQIFKTWLKVSQVEKLEPPLTLEDMMLANSLSKDTNVLNQNRFGYVYLKDSSNIVKKEEFPLQHGYSVENCSSETGLDQECLLRWLRAIERKRQAVIHGPPGTGKTYVAERLAKHLVGGGNGFVELVQFHPAYSYEDFIQGIRPQVRRDGGLEYPLVPGRFLEFCEKAAKRTGPCVLIIDEINRANLSRVFGELMYLLEYREKDIPLSGGKRFAIPKHVRIIGTMNTADRSIALVDHALRRRFAFLELNPNYEVLEKYHAGKGFPAAGLIETLKRVNQQIEDKHYQVGISFFLRDYLEEHLEDIWRMEIEPYLEEYFFDQSSKVDELRWAKIKNRVISG